MKNIRFALVAQVNGMLFTLTKPGNKDFLWEYLTFSTRLIARIVRQRLGDSYGGGEGKILISRRGTQKYESDSI